MSLQSDSTETHEIVKRFSTQWDDSDGDPPDLFEFIAECSGVDVSIVSRLVLVDQFRRWRAGCEFPVETYLGRIPELAANDELKFDLIVEELGYLEDRDGYVDRDAFAARFVDLPDEQRVELREQLAECPSLLDSAASQRFGSFSQAEAPADEFDALPRADSRRPNSPNSGQAQDEAVPAENDHPRQRDQPDGGGISRKFADSSDRPERIGRYVIRDELGHGSFGVVYLADDSELHRAVAVKVPTAERIKRAGGNESFLREARMVAQLDHPGIVPVFDVGETDDGQCFVVSKYIDGQDLSQRIRAGFPVADAVRLIAAVARALHEAHRQGMVHRDIKPANILLDRDGQPHIVDFGLALRDEDYGTGSDFVGTPAYMSPEQARGEGHRVDARSDLYSLGVVLYEILTGRRPHRGRTTSDLLQVVKRGDIRPPRQIDDSIPRELDRICLKALSRRVSDRYSTALDFAEELEEFAADFVRRGGLASAGTSGSMSNWSLDGATQSMASVASLDASGASSSGMAGSDAPVRIVPKGLRSFDAKDAEFFHLLVPGPRDRHGLPDSLRFWKLRLEETDADETFSVGLIYGPSGCGKSSLVKAGLLPVLESHVEAVYVEAAVGNTETRILKGLRKRFPELNDDAGLVDAFSTLRRSDVLPRGRKVAIIVDQFEQWLHTADPQQMDDLIAAFRQCDGSRVQAVVMVRDDFWMAATRFMRELEVPLVEGDNSAAVDLFDTRHARRVLAAYGRAFGALPENSRELTRANETFLKQAVDGLADDGKVVCVRLTLFAEMVKGKSWTQETLDQLGGTAGVGETYLEETLGANAPQRHRIHADGARGVLAGLLPEAGTDIRGAMRSSDELMQTAGMAATPAAFAELLRLLDHELRLVTPTEPDRLSAGTDSESSRRSLSPKADVAQSHSDLVGTGDSKIAASHGSTLHEPVPAADVSLSEDVAYGGASAEKSGYGYYQLSHDFLVPSLRQWLTRSQRSTFRGRTELHLRELAGDWSSRPEKRRLPSLIEFLAIHAATKHGTWSPLQRKMMSAALRHHVTRVLIVAVVGLVVGLLGYEASGRRHARSFEQRLVAAQLSEVPGIVDEMAGYRRWVRPQLAAGLAEHTMDDAEGSSRAEVALRMALLEDDPDQAVFLRDAMLRSKLPEFATIRGALHPYRQRITDSLWDVLENPSPALADARLQAAAGLAAFDPASERWNDQVSVVVDELVAVRPVYLDGWLSQLDPVGQKLIGVLSEVFDDRDRSAEHRLAAAEGLARFAADRPQQLFRFTLAANDQQFAAFAPQLLAHRDAAAEFFRRELNRNPILWDWPEVDPNWAPVPAEIVERIEKNQELEDNHGVVDDRCIIAGQLPYDSNFHAMCDELTKSGFRPIRIRPYAIQDRIQVAAIWHQDGVRWSSAHDLDADSLRTKHEQMTGDGYLAGDLAGYVIDGAVRYAALWHAKPTGNRVKTSLAIGLTDNELFDLVSPEVGPIPTNRQTFLDENGGPRHCLIIRDERGFDDRWEMLQGDHDFYLDTRFIGRRQLDVSVCRDPSLGPDDPGKPLMAGIWLRGDDSIATTHIGAVGASTHGHAARGYLELENLDYVPVGISAAEIKLEKPAWMASIWQSRVRTWRGHNELMRRHSTAIVAMLLLGHDEWFEKLTHAPDPTLRTYLIDRLAADTLPAERLLDRLRVEADASVRQALLLALAERPHQRLSPSMRDGVVAFAADAYENDADAGIHGACRRLLDRYEETPRLADLDSRLRAADAGVAAASPQRNFEDCTKDRDWFYGHNGHVMSVVDAGEFMMGFRPRDEYRNSVARRHRRVVNRRFAIATTETTVEQFGHFLKNHPQYTEREGDRGVERGGPQTFITFLSAAHYCNWLSEQAGVPRDQWCYEPNEKGEYGIGVTIPADSTERTGYRLPTEGEWEFACRAGTETMFHFGDAEEVIPKYAWMAGNSYKAARRVAQLRPNDIGLFDMPGNGVEITQTPWFYHYTVNAGEPVPEVVDDRVAEVVTRPGTHFSGRGSGFLYENFSATSARRAQFLLTSRSRVGVFRIARTLPRSDANEHRAP